MVVLLLLFVTYIGTINLIWMEHFAKEVWVVVVLLLGLGLG
jgi:hypothetical protein